MMTFFIIWFLSGLITWFATAVVVYISCDPIKMKDLFYLIPAMGLGCLGLAALILYGIANLLEPTWQKIKEKFDQLPDKIILQRKCQEKP